MYVYSISMNSVFSKKQLWKRWYLIISRYKIVDSLEIYLGRSPECFTWSREKRKKIGDTFLRWFFRAKICSRMFRMRLRSVSINWLIVRLENCLESHLQLQYTCSNWTTIVIFSFPFFLKWPIWKIHLQATCFQLVSFLIKCYQRVKFHTFVFQITFTNF